MEKPKPTQNHEQKQETPEDYVVATFHADADPDITTSPLTVIRSGQDGKGVRYDGGWIPGDILSVCDTDSEEGISPIELFVKVHKPVKIYGGHVVATKIVSLKNLQSREVNKGFNESYIQDLYGKSTEGMLKEGAEAAERIWQQKHPDSDWNELLDVKAPSETLSDGLDTEGNSEKSLKDEVSPAMGNLAVKTVEVSSVKTNEVSVNSPALVMTKEVMESIGAIKVNDSVGSPAVRTIGIKKPAVRAIGIKKPVEIDKAGANPTDLMAIEPVKKLVESDKASAAPADLPAAKSVENPVVEKSMETNEANLDILPEDFKVAIDSFKQLTEDNNNQFFAKAKYTTGELDRLRGLIKYNPTAMNNPAISEMITSTSGRIRDLEVSRSESVNKFKNDINSLLEGLKSEIENEDEKRRRLVKLTEHVDQMGVDDRVLGEVTNGLLDKFTAIRRIIDSSQNDRWGMDGYVDRMISVINGIISDLSIASGRRRDIVGGVEGIKREGYH
jgi:hypothetical protein